jgi:hypothetical protein
MNAYTFDRSSVPCPVCHRASVVPSVNLMQGLLTCPHCRSRFVVSVSGHYVRDPFAANRQRVNGKMIRRQSRPIARIMRDTGISKHSPLIAIVTGCLALGFTLSCVGKASPLAVLPDWLNQQVGRLSDAID